MAEGFVSLAMVLQGGESARRAEVAEPLAVAPVAVRSDVEGDEHAEGCVSLDAALRELTLLRIAALEAYDRSRVRLLHDLARDVLGRELVLAPADLEALARGALVSFAEHEPLALVLAPADAQRVRVDVPVRIDPGLTPGDFIVEVRDGCIDARFALRLAQVLEASP